MKKLNIAILSTLIISLFAGLLCVSNARAMSATVNIPENYAEVHAGEKVYIETEIKWPENDYRKDLIIEYSVKDQNGEEIAYLKTLKAIETQASFMESIAIPDSTKGGTYRVDVTIKDYEALNQDVVASFKVVAIGKDLFNTYLLIILGVVVFIAILLTVNVLALTNLRRRVKLNAQHR